MKETGFASSENLFLNNIGAICPAVCPNFSTQSFVNSRIKVNVGTTPNEIGRCFIADMLQQRTPHHEYLFPAKRFTSMQYGIDLTRSQNLCMEQKILHSFVRLIF